MSRIIERNDANRAREIDAGCRLKWCWEWLQKEVTIKHQGTSLNTTLGEFYRKVDAAGKARCLLCDEETKYAARGSQALLDHVRSQRHAKNLSANRTTSKMPGNFFTPHAVSEVKHAATYGINPVFLKAAAAAGSATVQPAVPEPKRLTPFQDRKAHVETIANLRVGKIQAVDLCARCLRRARQLKDLNFVITETRELAEKQARLAEQRLSTGLSVSPLDGIPVAVKDNFSTRGVQMSCGSQMLVGYKPPYTATVVSRLLDGGAVLTSKTNLDEFAMGCGTIDSVWGPTKNPWRNVSLQRRRPPVEDGSSTTYQEEHENPATDWHIAGGSSGGSAVAVATGSVFGALGSDTGGSVRNPASYCGVVGLKPTYGLLSRHGLVPLVNSLDVPGIFARTIDDAAIILNAVAGHDPLDSTSVTDPYSPVTLPDRPSVSGLHIGIPKEYHAPGLCQLVLDQWERAAAGLEAAGARVSAVSLPHTQHSIACYHLLSTAEIASNMARYDGLEYGRRSSDDESSTEALYASTRHAGFNDVVRGRILAGNYFLLRENYERYFIKAQRVQRLIYNDFQAVFAGDVDVLLTPTTLTAAPHQQWFSRADNRTRTQEQDVFTQPVNMAGVPAVTVPAALSPDGLPLGLQLIGRPFDEQTLLGVAKWLHQELECPTLNLDWLDEQRDS